MPYQDIVLLSTPDVLKLLNKYFLDSGLMYQFQDALRGVKDRLSDSKNYFKMPVERDSVQHTVFIARWTWILENFPCVEHIGRQNLLLILPTLIPISNFRVLVQEQKFSSLEDFFVLLRTLGNDYNTHIRVQKSIVRLNTQLAQKPKICLDYIVLHELAHLRVPGHGEEFQALLVAHQPDWQERRALLNSLPLLTP
jgi:hypothetical protein